MERSHTLRKPVRTVRIAVFIFILYTVAFGLSLLNSGVYWDDWAMLVGKSPLFISDVVARQMGNVFGPYLFILLGSFHTYTVYRIFTFAAYILAGLFLYLILKTIREIDSDTRVLLTTFFLLFPANDSRVLLVISIYTLAYVFFFFGWWLVACYLRSNNILQRIAALIILFISFSINSFILFYVVILGYIGYINKRDFIKRSHWKNLVRRYIDFIVLPLLFVVIKQYYWPPSGLYSEYNSVTFINLITAIYRSFSAYASSFIVPIVSAFYSFFNVSMINMMWQVISALHLKNMQSVNVHILLPILREALSVSAKEFFTNISTVSVCWALASIFGIYMTIKMLSVDTGKRFPLKINTLFFFIGCAVFYIAVFPYFVVDKTYSILIGHTDRNLLLISLGASFMLVYGLRLLCYLFRIKGTVKAFIFSIFIAMFVTYHLRMNIDYLKDWYKQLSIMANMKKHDEFRDHTTFLFNDNSQNMNVQHRSYSIYEYTGLMRMVFGDERRFGSSLSQFIIENGTQNQPMDKQVVFSNLTAFKGSFSELYNMKEYVLKNPEYIVDINPGTNTMTDKDLFNLMSEEYRAGGQNRKDILNIVTFSISPIILRNQ